jgi:hypothetical protein
MQNVPLQFWIAQKDVRKYLCKFLDSPDKSLYNSTVSGQPCNDYGFICSLISNGYLRICKWFYSIDPNACRNLWGSDICNQAAINGHLEMLQWARSNDFYWDRWTCINAAENGQLEVLKWIRFNGCPWNSNVIGYASQNGHLEVLQWAVDNGCPINGWFSYINNVQIGSLDEPKKSLILQWMTNRITR